MGLILTRSPFRVSRGLLDANASLIVEISEQINGVSVIKNTYNLVFRNKYFLDISNLINSELSDAFTYNGATSSYDGQVNNILLVKTTLSGTISDVAQSDIVNYDYATDGYLYSTDSVGYDFSSDLRANGYYAGSLDTVYKLKEASLNIPLLNTSLSDFDTNLVTNPTLVTDTDWVKETSDWTVSNGAGFLASTDLLIDRLYQVATLNGLNLRVKFDVSGFSGTGTATMRYPFNIPFTGNGTYSAVGVGELDRVQFQGTADDLSTPLAFSIDNVYVSVVSATSYEEVTVTAKYNGSTVGTKTISFDADTKTPNQDATFNIDNIDEVLITTDYGTKTINVEPISECKYSPFILTFRNKYGVDEDLWFFKKSSRELSVKSKDFRANQFKQRSAGMLTRSMQEFNKNGKESIELNSGFVPEGFNESFKQLMLSEKVKLYDYDNSSLHAVKIDNGSLKYKTSVNDKLINYTIDVEFSNNVIDDIV